MRNVQEIIKRGKRCVAIVDGEKLKISLEAGRKSSFKEGPMEDEKFEEFKKFNDFCLCKQYLLEMSSRRAWTVVGARANLTAKGYSPESIEKSIAIAIEYGYLDDEKYAAEYVQDRYERTGESRLRKELKRRGIADTVVSSVLEKANLGDEYPRAKALGEKRTAERARGIRTPKAKERVLRFLIWRGFEYETAYRVVKEIAER